MSKMKNMVEKVREFGAYLIDSEIEMWESMAAMSDRDMDWNGVYEATQHLVTLRDQKVQWEATQPWNGLMHEMLMDWLQTDESSEQQVIESDVVDFEVIGMLTVMGREFITERGGM